METSNDGSLLKHEEIDESIASEIQALHQKAAATMAQYLNPRSEELRRLADLRQQGWNNPAGDEFFKRQRDNADNPTPRTDRMFYALMKKIGTELHRATNVFALRPPDGKAPRILDMCMAPGGFLETALRLSPAATALAFSLPLPDGGHRVLLPDPLRARVESRFADITMFAHDMLFSPTAIPAHHPDAPNFVTTPQLGPARAFDLVICDGQVLRTHRRAPYREVREATRLTATQLALGLERLRAGGAMVVLLHRLDAHGTARLVRDFAAFSTVALHKPRTAHARRSSFYMVATDVRSDAPAAGRAVERWREQWRVATFEGAEGALGLLRRDVDGLEGLLGEFGGELVRLGGEVWGTQADGLARSSFIRRGGG